MSEYKVIGAYPFDYEGTTVSGHNCKFEYSKETREGYKICMEKDGVKYTLSLTTDEGESCSGWCTASFGCYSLVEEDTEEKITLRPKRDLELVEFEEESQDIENDLFTISDNGKDYYYPCGYAHLQLEGWVAVNNSEEEEEKEKEEEV